MRYILKYEDKEQFLADNPKEEIKLPIMWKYPREENMLYYAGNVQYDSQTGEVTSYEEPVLTESYYIDTYREDGKNDMFVIAPTDGAENLPYYPLQALNFIGGTSMLSDEPFIPGNLYYAFYEKSFGLSQQHFIPITSATQSFYEEYPGQWAETYSGFTFSAGEYGSISAETAEEYGYSGGTGGFYPTRRTEYKNCLFARNEDDRFLVYVAPTGTPVSSYTRIARIINLVQDNETNIPAALLEPEENGFLVTDFMMGSGFSSCGYTATKGQWFGVCSGINTGSTPIENLDNLGENASTDLALSFQEFYTDNETGVAEMTYYNNGNITGKSRQYYTIFYLTGDTGNIVNTPIETYSVANPNASDIVLGEKQGTRIPFYALTREHSYESGGSEYVEDIAYDGVYDLYMYKKHTGGTYQDGYQLSGYVGTITVVNENGLKKDSVTKIKPGFAHVLTPDSVYYNENAESSGGGSSDYVVPGASTDAPGSKIPLTDNESGGGDIGR